MRTRTKKKYIGKRTGILVNLFLFAIFAWGCRHEENPLPTTEEETSDAVQENQWLSSGHMQEYAERLRAYGTQIQPEREISEVTAGGSYNPENGILCDLNGDGISPELLFLQTQTDSYMVEIYYLENDGALSISKAVCEIPKNGDIQEIICNYRADKNMWDIVLVEKAGSGQSSYFCRYYNGFCKGYGKMPGSPSEQVTGADGSVQYDNQGFYRIEKAITQDILLEVQDYYICEEESCVKQKLPGYVEALEGVEEYIELLGYMDYPKTLYSQPVWLLDFSGKMELQNLKANRMARLRKDGVWYLLIESELGELGWIEESGSE